MQSLMMEVGSVFRDEEGLERGIEEIRSLKDRYQEISVSDKGKIFNYELMETIELGHQLDLSEVILSAPSIGRRAGELTSGRISPNGTIKTS